MPVNDDREQARRRHRALADPSRARILGELADDGPLDTRELARRVGLHANTVRVHLTALADAGLVAAEAVAPHGRGRPRMTYRATGDAPDEGGRRYRLLAEILTTLVARFGGEATAQLEEIGEAWGHHLVDSPPPLSSLPDAEAVERLIALLAGGGFRARARVEAALRADPDAALPVPRARAPPPGGRLPDPPRADARRARRAGGDDESDEARAVRPARPLRRPPRRRSPPLALYASGRPIRTRQTSGPMLEVVPGVGAGVLGLELVPERLRIGGR